jgi:hypothetical protein
MLNRDEIQALRKRVAERSQDLYESLHGGSTDVIAKRTEALASLHNTPGWEVVVESLEKMICELLVPEELADMSPEAYAVSGEAKRLTIQAIQSVIDSVKSAAAAKAATVMAEPGGVSE